MKSTDEYINILKQYKAQMADKYGIQHIGIFGSVARGEQKETSDLDVYVKLKTPKLFFMYSIHEDLERLCKCKIDLIRLREGMNSLLLKKIETEGIYV